METKLLGEPNKAEETAKKVPGKPFQKGEDPRRNLYGRPLGALSFSTKWFKFIDEVAKLNKVNPEEIDKRMLTVAYKQIMDGQYNFWKDINDRVYGQATQKTDLTSGGNKIGFFDNVQMSEEEKVALLAFKKARRKRIETESDKII